MWKGLEKINNSKNYRPNTKEKIISSIKMKRIFYTKAGKDNSIVILDTEDNKWKIKKIGNRQHLEIPKIYYIRKALSTML